MLIGGILLGLLLGLLAGGRLRNLANIQLRWTWLLVAAVIVRFSTEALLGAGVDFIQDLRLPLLAAGFAILLTGLWVNRGYPGLSLAFLGILSNAVVIVVNGGYMPIWQTSLTAAGFTPEDVTSALHIIVQGDAASFLTQALILGDVIPVPVPLIQNVASLGDLFLSLGLSFFLFAGLVRVPTPLEEQEEASLRARLASLAGGGRTPRPDERGDHRRQTGLTRALQSSAALDRPIVFGGQRSGVSAPALAPLGQMTTAEFEALQEGAPPPIALPRPSAEVLARVRRHPYVRLALNGSFTALWAGQFVSIFGDRIHQVALAAAVLVVTGSPLATSLVFVAATLPNLVFGPIAGTFVDRWDHKEVLIVSDLLRAATVLVIPVAIVTNIALVYPFVFLMTTISVFFRPARIAILPRIVREDELLTANSALWVGETLGDVIGWPLAGLFVTILGAALPIAFWLDGATYAASALLLSTVAVRALDRRGAGVAATDELEATGLVNELKAGWRFLRHEPVLLANTVQATFAQLTVGVLIGLTTVYAEEVFGDVGFDFKAVYAFIEGAQASGNLIGGFVVGLIGVRFAKGKMIILGYAAFGLLTMWMALTGSLPVVLAIGFGIGIANMVFVIPSQTLFQERTPQTLIGRVIGFRFALVFGAMTLSIGFGGLLAEAIGTTTVFFLFGLVSLVAGVAGLFVSAVRDA
ncbi:MAG: MFS transporter [Candidatus Limnocylindrales bacterium]